MYRWVKDASVAAPGFVENFASDAERGQKPLPDEHPGYMEGRSAFDTLEHAREAWMAIYDKLAKRKKGKPVQMRVGNYIAAVELTPNHGFEVDDPPDADPRGHLWIKGDKTRLAAAAGPIYEAMS